MSENGHNAGNGQKGRMTPEDRRIRRSRQMLHEAMIALVLERGYEAVTIKDIVDRADVSRSTFYVHYKSKEDLLTGGIEDLRALLMAHQRAALDANTGVAERSLGFSLALFEHAQTYRDIYRVLVGERGSAIIMNRMRALLADLVGRDLAAIAPRSDMSGVPRSAVVQFVVGALMSLLAWWMDRKADVAPAEVDAIFRRLTIPAVVAAIDGSTPPPTSGSQPGRS